jgi:hypothetical protein
MKKTIMVGLAAIAAGALVAMAAQDTDITPRQVRDPLTLETYLEANATDAQARIAVLESGINTSANPVVTGLLTAGAISTTGDVTIAEGALTDSKIVSADIKNGEIVNADINASAAITGGKLDLTSGTTAVTASGLVKGGTLGIGAGVLARVAGTLVWIEGGITNALDADVTSP